MQSSPRRVILVAFEGFQVLDLTGPAEVFSSANRHEPGAYEPCYASESGGPLRASCGLTIETRKLAGVRPGPRDTVLVVGGDEEALRGALRGEAGAALGGWLRRAAGRAERVGSVCSGSFVLAAAGLLAGRRAATHWSAIERLAAYCPEATVDGESIYVQDGALWTSAGVTTGIDMALAMVEQDHGRRVADQIAARLVLYARRPGFQSQFAELLVDQGRASDPLGPALAWARSRLDGELSVEALARKAGLSPRTFHRRCREHLGQTPAKLVERLRVDRARALLSTTDLSMKEVARRCGLRDGAQLGRTFERAMGMAPRGYRMLFSQGKGA